MKINVKICVDALASAAMNREAALHAEIAVGLLVFHVEQSTDVDAKTVLREIYASAGYVG